MVASRTICWLRISIISSILGFALLQVALLLRESGHVDPPGSSRLISTRAEPNLTSEDIRDIVTRFQLLPYEGSPVLRAPSVVKMIHFMYKGYQLDDRFKPLLASWRAVYPDYQMYFWTDAEINLLIRRRYPAWQHMYHHQLSNYLERSDIARAFVLHAMGGWYTDLDTGCLSRADRLTSNHALILPLEPYLHALNNLRMPRLVSNAIMYSAPQHPFWMFYLHHLRKSLVGQKPRNSTLMAVFVTGPVLLTDTSLMYRQAHRGIGCPGPWCPHLAPPVQFLPVYDGSTQELRNQFRYLCTLKEQERLFDSVEFKDECRRFQKFDFAQHPLDPTESHTYHLFIHLNQRKNQTSFKSDVRRWFLKLVHGPELLDSIAKFP